MSQQAKPTISTLVPGQKYKVTFDDCCAQGFFTAVFSRYEPDDDGDPYEAVFDGARLQQLWGPYEIAEVTGGD